MHGLGKMLITSPEVLAALFWGWGTLWKHWAACVGEKLPFEIFYGRHQVSEVFYVASWRWNLIPANSWGVIQGKFVSVQECCRVSEKIQISYKLCSVVPQNHRIPESQDHQFPALEPSASPCHRPGHWVPRPGLSWRTSLWLYLGCLLFLWNSWILKSLLFPAGFLEHSGSPAVGHLPLARGFQEGLDPVTTWTFWIPFLSIRAFQNLACWGTVKIQISGVKTVNLL